MKQVGLQVKLQGYFIPKPEGLREGGGCYNPKKIIYRAGCLKRSFGGPETSVRRHGTTEVTSLRHIWGNKYLELTLLPPYHILLAPPMNWRESETKRIESGSYHLHRAICL